MQRVPLVTILARVTHADAVAAVAFSPDGNLLATASWDKTARIVVVEDGREVARVTQDATVVAVAFSPDGKLLATASDDKNERPRGCPRQPRRCGLRAGVQPGWQTAGHRGRGQDGADSGGG
ncbi:hypothetical protein MES5069_360165 [Mesorhizobium escarrei]|uniref:Anaphase-promoting complex subunit 4 WD40 domain-containing protein n=2 Tax=Mesorhizobium escarrei TaxID=666018 RepID=A0ABN8K0W6_9HYPH|nr:hypothetical protein MES5069_360165 [Mesorhizobium escarrei]